MGTPPQNQGGAAGAATAAALSADPFPTATRILALQEAVSLDELANDEEYVDIVQDMRDEASKVRRFYLFYKSCNYRTRVCQGAGCATVQTLGILAF